MDKMEWALRGIDYLQKARTAIHGDFNDAMGEARGYPGAHRDSWHGSCKNILHTLYHFSSEFVADSQIPSEKFASPDVFETRLTDYRAWVQGMAEELNSKDTKHQARHKVDIPPYLVEVARRQVENVMAGIDYVLSKKPHALAASPVTADVTVNLILGLARRFHEAVLSLKIHPHNGAVFTVKDEWDRSEASCRERVSSPV